MRALEETLLCKICSDPMSNPHSIKSCNHTFCSLCIRRHFDKHVNQTNTSDRCPMCNGKCSAQDLEPNAALAGVVAAYKLVRDELLSELMQPESRGRGGSSSSSSGSGSSRNGKASGAKIERRLAFLGFHGKPKKYVLDAVLALCAPSQVKPDVAGLDQDDLVRLYREILHLHNAQVGALEPLAFDAVIREVNNKEKVRRQEASRGERGRADAERLKSGRDTTKLKNDFKLLVQAARKHKQREAEAVAAAASSSSSSTALLSDELVPGEYRWGPWRVAFSEKLGRPFFYNTDTDMGTFDVPVELDDAVVRLRRARRTSTRPRSSGGPPSR